MVNRKRKQYKYESDEEDKIILNYLIDRLLLGKKVSFPIQDLRKSGYDDIAVKFNLVGTARSNIEE